MVNKEIRYGMSHNRISIFFFFFCQFNIESSSDKKKTSCTLQQFHTFYSLEKPMPSGRSSVFYSWQDYNPRTQVCCCLDRNESAVQAANGVKGRTFLLLLICFYYQKQLCVDCKDRGKLVLKSTPTLSSLV